MILDIINQTNIPLISLIIIAIISLIVPLIMQSSNFLNHSVILISIVFFINLLVVDLLFISGIKPNLLLFSFAKIYEFTIHLEIIGIVFINIIGILWICSILYTTGYLKVNSIESPHQFIFFINLTILIGILIAVSANLFTMFISYELLTIATIPLITHVKRSNTRKELLHYIKILTGSSILLFMPAMIIIYHDVGYANFTNTNGILSTFSSTKAVILFLMFIFGIAKAGLFPMHSWLPSAMVAPYPVSALLHAVIVVKAGLFCIIKIIVYIFGLQLLHDLFNNFNWIILLPLFTILYSAYKALNTYNIKTILAYSTINQLSIVLLSAFMFTKKGITAAILHIVSHALSKICLFFAAGNCYSLIKTYDIADLSGIKSNMPKNSFFILFASLSLIGMPPLAGFFSKLYILLAASYDQQFIIMFIVVISSILSIMYFYPIISSIYHDKDLSQNSKNIEYKLPVSMSLSIIICIIMNLMFFFLMYIIIINNELL